MLRYMHAKDRDAAIRGALVLADLKAHDGRAALPVLWEEGPAAAGLTEARVLQVLVLEAQRQKDAAMDDWKDYVPKGRGVTKRI